MESMCCISHHCILTKCVWKTCVDLGNKRNPLWPWENSQYCSSKQNKTLLPNFFPRWLCLKMWRYLMSIFSNGGKKCCSVSIWDREQGAQSIPCHVLKPIKRGSFTAASHSRDIAHISVNALILACNDVFHLHSPFVHLMCILFIWSLLKGSLCVHIVYVDCMSESLFFCRGSTPYILLLRWNCYKMWMFISYMYWRLLVFDFFFCSKVQTSPLKSDRSRIHSIKTPC